MDAYDGECAVMTKERILDMRNFFLEELEKFIENHENCAEHFAKQEGKTRPYLITTDNTVRIKNIAETAEILHNML